MNFKKVVLGVLITISVFLILLIGGILAFLFAIKDEIVSSGLIPTVVQEIRQDDQVQVVGNNELPSSNPTVDSQNNSVSMTMQNLLLVSSIKGTINELQVEAQTNMPDGTKFGLAVISDEEIVKDQVYTSKQSLSTNENKISQTIDLSDLNLKPGKYEFEIYSLPASEQSAEVQAEIGSDGSKLVGDEVESTFQGGKRTYYLEDTVDFSLSKSGVVTQELLD